MHSKPIAPSRLTFAAALLLGGLAAPGAFSQEAPPADNAAAEEPVILSPFEVTTTSDVGYEARESLAGSRLNTDLKDIASQVQVMTPEFLQDLAITDMADAISYSLNVENASEFFDVTAENVAGNEGSIQAFAGSARSRGLGGTMIGRDFFQTYIPIDSYNTERFTFAPGANNMLFGNATPAGSVDSTTKRARPHKRSFSLAFRVDDRGSTRTVLDFNQPIKKIAAVRWVALRSRENESREPSFADQDRHYVSATVTPHRRISLRAWYEHYDAHNQPVRNTLLRDRASAWVAAGRPAFDNSRTLAGVTARRDQPWIRTPAARHNPFYVMNAGVGDGFIRLINPAATAFGTVQTVGEASLSAVPDNFDWSQTDPSLAPIDVAFAGNAVQNRRRGRNYGAVVNLNPIDNLHLELGSSTEVFKHRYVDMFRFSELKLYADANQWAVDSVGALKRNAAGALVPNPYFGRFYMEDVFVAAGTTLNEYNQQRASAAYQLDFRQRAGWRKWLGRHNVTGVYDRLVQDNAGSGQRHDPRLATPLPGGPAGTASNVFFRYYLPDAANPGSHAVNLPFDPMQFGRIDLPNSGGAQLRGYDSDGANGGVNVSRKIIHSRSFAVQSFLGRDRVVLNYSRRNDYVRNESPDGFGWPLNAAGGAEYVDKIWDTILDSPHAQDSAGEKSKANTGVVVHPFRWLSAHYSELANAQVTGLTRYSYDGSEIELGTGAGREYGVTLRLPDNRLSVRINKYTSTLVGVNTSTLRSANSVGLAVNGGGGNLIRGDLPALEQAALQAGAPRDPKWTHFQELLLSIPFTSTENPATFNPPAIPGGSQLQDSYDFIVDRESEGYEVTLVGNPTPQWRVSISGARNISRETNIAPQYFEFIQDRLPVWARYLNAPTWRGIDDAPTDPGRQTLAQLLQASIANFYFIQRSAGQPNVMDRKYRVTATTSYRFRAGRLKGFRAGATYLWRSPAAIGFRQIDVSDNPYIVPGLTAPTMTVSDPLNPIRGGSLSSFDAFAGYSRKLLKGKITWDVQLNVRNLLDRQDLLPQRALTTGEPVVFTMQAPRTIILTNTFSF